MAQAIIGEMLTPLNDDGVRLRYHPLTETDAVVMKDGRTLTEALNTLTEAMNKTPSFTFTVSEEKPTGQGLWFKVRTVQENNN